MINWVHNPLLANSHSCSLSTSAQVTCNLIASRNYFFPYSQMWAVDPAVITGMAFLVGLPQCIMPNAIFCTLLLHKCGGKEGKKWWFHFSVTSFFNLFLHIQTNMPTIPPKNSIFPHSIIPTVARMCISWFTYFHYCQLTRNTYNQSLGFERCCSLCFNSKTLCT
jgi:hypothetical protein